MSQTAPGGNVGEHEWCQSGVGGGCDTVRFGQSKEEWDENNIQAERTIEIKVIRKAER